MKVDNISAKAVSSPRFAGVAVSWYFIEKFKLKPQRVVPLTLSSADGVTTINQDVLNSLNVKWKETEIFLPAMVFPGTGFDVLLRLLWIVKAGVSLDAERQRLVHGANQYTFKSMVVPELPKEVLTFVIYAAEHCRVPAGENAKLVLAPFEQGAYGGMAKPKLPRGVAARVSVYHQFNVEGFLPPWELISHSTAPIKIQQGQQVGVWISNQPAIAEKSSANKSTTTAYVVMTFLDLHCLILPGWPVQSELVQTI